MGKGYAKISFEDIEKAEAFFESENKLKEFLLAVLYYYRSKPYSIKNKYVQKYFDIYKEKMDFVIISKYHGTKKHIRNE